MEVKVLQLSKLLASQGPIDLMKIDIEGAEEEVLDELAKAKTLERVERILLEFHHNFPKGGPRLSKVAELLTDNGFIFGLTANSAAPNRFQDIFIEAIRKS